MHSLKLKLEIFQLLRKSLATCSEFEKFSVNSSDPGLSNTAGSGSGFPVKTTCLQLLQFITKAAQENDETLRRTFFYAAEGKIKPFSHRLQAAFSEAKNFGFLNDLPIFPFFPLQSWSKFDEKMHDETLNFDFFLTTTHHFAAHFWSFAARCAAVDPLACSTITGIPLKAAATLNSASYVNIFNFIGKNPQMFCFNASEKSLLEILGKTDGNMVVTRGGGGKSPQLPDRLTLLQNLAQGPFINALERSV